MKTILKVAAIFILGIIAIKLAFGLLAVAISVAIPLLLLYLIGLFVWKIIGDKNLWDNFFGAKKSANINEHVLPNWQNDDFNQQLNQYDYSKNKNPNYMKY